MASTKDIRLALKDVLSQAPSLSEIKTWHMVTGFIPDAFAPTGSVGSGRTVYAEYTNDLDEATTTLPVYIAVSEADPERAEEIVQALGEEARAVLVSDNPTLGGLVSRVNAEELAFDTAVADGDLLVHYVTLNLSISHWSPRIRPTTDPTADTVDLTVEQEV